MENIDNTDSEEQLSYSDVEKDNETEKKHAQLEAIINFCYLFYSRSKEIVKKYFWLFLLLIVIGMGFTLYQIINREIDYQATITFLLKDDEAGSAQTNFADPLSTFLLSRSTIQTINIDRVAEIIYSQKLLSIVFFLLSV